MSVLFDRSLDKPKYFERQSDFERRLSSYSFRNKIYVEPVVRNKNVPLPGLGGVPLSGSGDDGVCVYVDPFDSHSLIIGSTGSKKSRLIAMPTVRLLCDSKETMIICDPKAEIFERTAGYLEAHGYKDSIYILNLRNPNKGACWNPFAVAYEYYRIGNINKAYEFVNDISNNLLLMERQGRLDPFWDNSFAALFLGLSILLFKICKDFNDPPSAVNIGNLIALRKHMFTEISYVDVHNNEIWKYVKGDYRSLNEKATDNDNLIETALMGIMTAADVTRQSILATFDQKMRIFMTQPDLVKMLSDNTIKYDDIINKPCAIFLVLPDEKTSFHGLVSLFVKQSYEYIIAKLQEDSILSLKHRVNYILDEFSSLPTISDFPAMITAARSRNIRFNIFIQSKHQLILRYNADADTILSNCNNWIFLTSRELTLLKDISELGGKVYESNTDNPVLSISDLQRLDKDVGEALILCGRLKPYVTRLPDIEVYDEGRFTKLDLREREFLEDGQIPIFDFSRFQNLEPRPLNSDDKVDSPDLPHVSTRSDFSDNKYNDDETLISKENLYIHKKESKPLNSDNEFGFPDIPLVPPPPDFSDNEYSDYETRISEENLYIHKQEILNRSFETRRAKKWGLIKLLSLLKRKK